jgi:DNA repair protein SbcD/Mre11
MSIKILHFADAHIDMANYGRHDSQSGLPLRVMDFLKSLDIIIDTAISENVDMVLFAGDAYKDRNPAPTFQREWGKRIMRLSRAGIPTLLLIGNHDLSPALGRANTLEAFDTLDVEHVQVLENPGFLGPAELEGLPIQVIALPWISRSRLMADWNYISNDISPVYDKIEHQISGMIENWLEEKANPDLPIILLAHCSVQGAQFGNERSIMLGSDLVLPNSLVKDARLDYVALGHIHKKQNLNENAHPPVIYPGSIERVDFNESKDDKFFVLAQIERSHTQVEWRQLKEIRPFIDRIIHLEKQEEINSTILQFLPSAREMRGAIFRLVLEYPRDWEASINEASLRELTKECFEFHLVKRPQVETRIRLPGNKNVGSLSALDLLDFYLKANNTDKKEIEALISLAKNVIGNEFRD